MRFLEDQAQELCERQLPNQLLYLLFHSPSLSLCPLRKIFVNFVVNWGLFS